MGYTERKGRLSKRKGSESSSEGGQRINEVKSGDEIMTSVRSVES